MEPTAWKIHFFKRHVDDDAAESVPTIDFLESIPVKVASEIQAVLEAVAEAPPPSFSGGGKWEVMRGDMAGIYEVRARHGSTLYRLFCLLERDNTALSGPAIICMDGLSKANSTAIKAKDYARIRRLVEEFRKRAEIL